MTEEVFATENLIVTRLVGPAGVSPDRLRWQLTPLRNSYVTLTRAQALSLAYAILADAEERDAR